MTTRRKEEWEGSLGDLATAVGSMRDRAIRAQETFCMAFASEVAESISRWQERLDRELISDDVAVTPSVSKRTASTNRSK